MKTMEVLNNQFGTEVAGIIQFSSDLTTQSLFGALIVQKFLDDEIGQYLLNELNLKVEKSKNLLLANYQISLPIFHHYISIKTFQSEIRVGRISDPGTAVESIGLFFVTSLKHI